MALQNTELIMSLTIEDIERLLDQKFASFRTENDMRLAEQFASFRRENSQQLAEQLGPLARDLELLKADVGTLKMDVGTLGRDFRNLEDEVARMDRSVKAIESFPVPYGRPRTYHSATELQSVSKPVRRRQGYMG